jgi:hypothetical protein
VPQVVPTTPPPEVPDDARCLDCGYALRGLTTHRCPECGRAFYPVHPWTMRLPHHPAFTRWLAVRVERPVTGIERTLPWTAAALVLYASVYPSLDSRPFYLGLWIFGASLFGICGLRLLRHALARAGLIAPTITAIDARHERVVALLLASFAILVPTRIPLYAGFLLSSSRIVRVADSVNRQPWEPMHPTVQPFQSGIYTVTRVRRCPHGLQFVTVGGGSFYYNTSPTECSRMGPHPVHLNGPWYAGP